MTAYAYDLIYNYGKRSHEIEKHHMRWYIDGIYKNYLHGLGYDVGYAGEAGKFLPVVSSAWGLDLKTPGYDGLRIPTKDIDYIFASHMLEHVDNPKAYIKEWFDSVKVGGHVFIVVPSKFRYERKDAPPSQWNLGHKTFYTPGVLFNQIEDTLAPRTYEIVHFRDNNDNYDYTTPLDKHPQGAYDMEVCIKRRI